MLEIKFEQFWRYKKGKRDLVALRQVNQDVDTAKEKPPLLWGIADWQTASISNFSLTWAFDDGSSWECSGSTTPRSAPCIYRAFSTKACSSKHFLKPDTHCNTRAHTHTHTHELQTCRGQRKALEHTPQPLQEAQSGPSRKNGTRRSPQSPGEGPDLWSWKKTCTWCLCPRPRPQSWVLTPCISWTPSFIPMGK